MFKQKTGIIIVFLLLALSQASALTHEIHHLGGEELQCLNCLQSETGKLLLAPQQTSQASPILVRLALPASTANSLCRFRPTLPIRAPPITV